jgi:hypothetical protein
MAINFFNGLGVIDLGLIKDEDVQALDDARKEALHAVIETVIAKGAATERHATAVKRVRDAMLAEDAAHAAHLAASPPPTFAQARQASIDAFNRSR